MIMQGARHSQTMRDVQWHPINASEGAIMNLILQMGGGSVQDDWPELGPENDNDRADDPDTDPTLTEGDQNRPAVPASDPESGA